MLQNVYFLAKIGADTAENEQHFAEICQKLATTLRVRRGEACQQWQWRQRLVDERAERRHDARVAVRGRRDGRRRAPARLRGVDLGEERTESRRCGSNAEVTFSQLNTYFRCNESWRSIKEN